MILISIIESLLFTSGEPLSLNTLVKVTGATEVEVKQALEELKKINEEERSGLTLFEHNESYQLVSKATNQLYVQKLVSGIFEEKLTPTALECLTIVAYRGPLGRSQIDLIRGVNSGYILHQLVLRGLVERKNDPNRGNAFLYSITADYLKHLGLARIEELPHYDEYHSKDLQALLNDVINVQPEMGETIE
jgi:segregation and condensation protein B